jgi:hypothetical protein
MRSRRRTRAGPLRPSTCLEHGGRSRFCASAADAAISSAFSASGRGGASARGGSQTGLTQRGSAFSLSDPSTSSVNRLVRCFRETDWSVYTPNERVFRFVALGLVVAATVLFGACSSEVAERPPPAPTSHTTATGGDKAAALAVARRMLRDWESGDHTDAALVASPEAVKELFDVACCRADLSLTFGSCAQSNLGPSDGYLTVSCTFGPVYGDQIVQYIELQPRSPGASPPHSTWRLAQVSWGTCASPDASGRILCFSSE